MSVQFILYGRGSWGERYYGPSVGTPTILHGALALGFVHAFEVEVAAMGVGAEALALEKDEGDGADDLLLASVSASIELSTKLKAQGSIDSPESSSTANT